MARSTATRSPESGPQRRTGQAADQGASSCGARPSEALISAQSRKDCIGQGILNCMRIVAGQFAGRDLVSLQGSRVRPASEAVRAAMLDMLREDLPKARILDLFAGTGALGLEAISRGAAYADFVEFRPDSLHSLRANIAALRLLKNTRVFRKDALPFAAALEADKYDIAFVDPPYGS